MGLSNYQLVLLDNLIYLKSASAFSAYSVENLVDH